MHRRELEREYEQDSQFDDFDNLQDGEKEELIILQEEIDPDYEPTEDCKNKNFFYKPNYL